MRLPCLASGTTYDMGSGDDTVYGGKGGDIELDSAFNQLVQAHSSFGDIGDDTGLGKKDVGYNYILPVPEPLI